jgi:tetratricopeptide (TPR) repeat protein
MVSIDFPGTAAMSRNSKPARRLILAIGCAALMPAPAAAQARIAEETRLISTYPFSEPDPVPILTRDRRLYPYHSFEGYAHESEPREWKVVRMENELVEVYVLPQVGGKIWGAVVKKSGHEFIYRNEVLKFRNIALRGPWTSGGIEFNFGVIGHAPSTATPVDYVLRENADGSVSCIVGAMDLPSRTHWRVEIRLPPDRATFETRALWYNPTPLEQPYYNWMTAAAFARNDLEVSIPGNAYLQHSGMVKSWPVDEQDRYLPVYRDNTFDGSKSYHVVGELHDFFGGYYRDAGWGFGHWARYEDMPGQKLWLWALSREGGIWEDLLTDTDGQYIEFQAGRLFVQYSPDASVNPITQAGFDPLSTSRWSETWFPVEGIGGLSDASALGAMHIDTAGGRLTVRVNSFLDAVDTLALSVDGERIATRPMVLPALEPVEATFDVPAGRAFRVRLPVLSLDYASDPAARRLSRPFATDASARPGIPEADRAAFEAKELAKGRRYAEARAQFEKALASEPWHRDALLGLAELDYRSGRYAPGLERADRARQLDAYDAKANFIAGILCRALGRTADARDAFGWAARSIAYRSAAYTQLADLMLAARDLDEAVRYARLAIDNNRTDIPAWQVLAIAGRLMDGTGALSSATGGGEPGGGKLAAEALGVLLDLDPLHHFALAEAWLASASAPALDALMLALGGEYPDETLLELAISYVNRGFPDDALKLLRLGIVSDARGGIGLRNRRSRRPRLPEASGVLDGPVQQAWRAWLSHDQSLLGAPGSVRFVFPFRTETIPVLEWAAARSTDWQWRYLLALNLWAVDRDAEASAIFDDLGDVPDFAPFYAARAHLSGERGRDATADFRRAVALEPADRILHIELIRHLQDSGAWAEALDASAAARTHFAGDFNLDLLHARSLVHTGHAAEAAEILGRARVLPSENARESHRLWEQAHTLVALDAMDASRWGDARRHLRQALEWPESLGQGRPYQPEERLVRFLLASVEQRTGNRSRARESFEAVVMATPDPSSPSSRLDLLAVPALAGLGRNDDVRAIAQRPAPSAVGRLAMTVAQWLLGMGSASANALPETLRTANLLDDFDGQMIRRALLAAQPGSPGPRP